jgi:hypothetical protein
MLIAATKREFAAVAWASGFFILIGLADGLWKTPLLNSRALDYWAYDLAKWTFLPVLLLSLVHRIAKVVPRDYGLSADLGTSDVFYVLPLPLLSLFFAVVIATAIANGLLHYPKPYFNSANALASLGPLWIVAAFYFSLTAGLWESIFLIGLPWLWFSRGERVPASRRRLIIVGSAFLFAACHWENGMPNAIGAFTFQLLAFWWYVKLRTLWPIIGAHFLIDLYYFWPSGI